MAIKHYLYRMCLLNNSLHFGIEIKAVLEGRGFRPNFLGKARWLYETLCIAWVGAAGKVVGAGR
jgi:hypothetical protein